MTKQQLIELIERHVPDGEEVAWSGFWVKSDVEEWYEQDLSADQWLRVVEWFEKFQDSSYDLNSSVDYALGEQD